MEFDGHNTPPINAYGGNCGWRLWAGYGRSLGTPGWGSFLITGAMVQAGYQQRSRTLQSYQYDSLPSVAYISCSQTFLVGLQEHLEQKISICPNFISFDFQVILF
ncbi:hypothetical protein XENTR_v10019400 [Xenopus tropicalis]|nr:hypothetical protein XENTR_v10019400 [Xenopus tropicalis]